MKNFLMGAGKWLGMRVVGAGATVGLIGGASMIPGVGGAIRDVGSSAGNVLSEPAANTEVASKKFGFYEMVQWFGEILQLLGVGGGIPQTIMKFAENGAAKTRDPNASLASAGVVRGGNPGAGGPSAGGTDPSNGGSGTENNEGFGWGTAALATVGLGGTGLAGFAGYKAIKNRLTPGTTSVPGGAADDAIKVMQGAQLGDDAAEGGAKGIRGLLSKIPGGRWGKAAAIGAGVLGGTMLFGGSPAEASTLSSAAAAAGGGVTAAVKTPNDPAESTILGVPKSDAVGMGLSILGGKAAAQTVATAAAPALASLGVKAIPGIASIWAAGETVYNVSSDLMRGDFKKAGLNLVSGVGETVAGLGGAVTYLTVGTAWREGVRYGGAKMLGEENTIEHSTVVSLGSTLKDAFFGAANNTENAPAPQRLAPRANGPALAF